MVATRTYLGPLTTTFTAPSTCTEVMLVTQVPTAGWMAQSCLSGAINDNVSCWPPATSGVTSPVPIWGFGVYSPGLICPASHTTACSSTSGGAGDFDFQFPLDSAETAAGCCPRLVHCSHSSRETCLPPTHKLTEIFVKRSWMLYADGAVGRCRRHHQCYLRADMYPHCVNGIVHCGDLRRPRLDCQHLQCRRRHSPAH